MNKFLLKTILFSIVLLFISVVGYGQSKSFNDSDDKQSLILSPNPSQQYFQISGATNELNIVITDIIGREVNRRFEIKPGEKIDISDLRNGIYIVRILDNDNGFLKSLKIRKV